MLSLDERANDGFWTPGMGEAGFSATASAESAQVTPVVINPKAVSAELRPTVIFTTIVKIVAPATVTQLVEPAQATQAIDAATNVFDGTVATPNKAVQGTVAPINPKATIALISSLAPPRVFGGASSSGLIRILGATAAPSALDQNEALTTLQPTNPISKPIVPTSSSERIFQPFTQSQIRVAAAATASSFQPEQQSVQLRPCTRRAANNCDHREREDLCRHIGYQPRCCCNPSDHLHVCDTPRELGHSATCRRERL
ncbi:hypothetical protein BJY59DRAFT_278788 [Rhodotorula toruloides]